MARISNFIIILVLSIGLIFSICYSFFHKEDHTKWQETFCQILRVVPGKSGGRQFVYWVNNTEYRGWTGRGYQGAVPGDVYKILYNPNNPEKYFWNSELAYFYDAEPRDTTHGEILSVVNAKDGTMFIEYRYYVNGEIYVRLHNVPTSKFRLLNKGDKCDVIYAPSNYARSIII